MATRAERTFSSLPPALKWGVMLVMGLQIGLHYFRSAEAPYQFDPLSAPQDESLYRHASLGSTRLLGSLLLLKLQGHDNQLGQHLNYRHLDYQHLAQWLLLINRLNRESQYPAFLASRVYSQVKHKHQLRTMIDVIRKIAADNPRLHWRRMSEAVILAKHQLGDLNLALEIAAELSQLSHSVELPHWARDMRLIVLDEMGEKQAALMLINSLLQTGNIQDPDEIRFLQQRLLKIQQELLMK